MTPPLTALVEALREMIDTQSSWEASIEKIIGRQPNIFQRAIDRGRAALSAFEAEPQGWRTMETAPKDGTRVDLWCRAPGFFAGQCRVPDCWFYDGYWRRSDPEFGGASGTSRVHNVTHWQPLPLPPEING